MPLRILRIGGGGGGGAADFKNARRVASITPLPAYTRVDNVITANAFGALPAIDGVNLVVGESFLLRNGASLSDNGLWDVTVLGDGGTAFVLTRSADADTDAEVTSGMRVPILTGSFAGQTFYLATPDPIVLNTTGLVFALDLAASVWKDTRRTASEVALPAYTRTGNDIVANAVGALPSIGGVSLAVGDSFMLRNGAALADNGLWDVVVLGDGATAFQLTRSADASTSASMQSGIRVPISEGVFAGQVLYLATQGTITLNTTGLDFSLDAASTYYKGTRRSASDAVLPAYTRVANTITGNAVGALPTIGGVALVAGDSFLLRHGASNVDNGMWDVTRVGDAGTTYQLVRSPDANVSSMVTSGMRIPIVEGTYAGQAFRLLTANPIDLNVTALTFGLDTGLPPGMLATVLVAIGAYANNETINGVAATPGWNVVTEFDLDSLPTAGALLDGIILVSNIALTCNLRLYDVTGAAAVAGSTLTSTSLTGERKTSADLTAVLVAGRRYQIQAECTGGAAPTDWAVVRYATLISSP